jgi:uncharacterized membrane protein (UPF0127 family)
MQSVLRVLDLQHLASRLYVLCAHAALTASLGLAGGCVCAHEVSVESDAVTRLRVCVEIAESEDARREGLRGRRPLDADEGLLLVFPREDDVCLTNEGVTFAIDAVFVDTAGVVRARASFSRDDGTLVCVSETQTVLEVARDVARDVRMGDRLIRTDAPRP